MKCHLLGAAATLALLVLPQAGNTNAILVNRRKPVSVKLLRHLAGDGGVTQPWPENGSSKHASASSSDAFSGHP